MSTRTWQDKALEIKALAIAEAESLKEKKDRRSSGISLFQIGKATAISELLKEFGEEEKPKIVRLTNLLSS